MSTTTTLFRTMRRRRIGSHLFLAAVGVVVALPIAVAVATSLKPPDEVFTIPPRFLPSRITFENYDLAWNTVQFGRYLFNSVVMAGIVVASEVTFAVLSAYAFSHLRFPGKEVLYWVVLGTLMIPGTLTFIPNFVLISRLGLANTFAGLTLPLAASAFGVFLLRQFFTSIPRELKEAAFLDGASHLRFLWSVVVPMSRGAIAVLAIISFLGAWNEYLWPLVITSDQGMRTVQIGIKYFLDESGESRSAWGALMAAAVIAMGPTLAVFLFFRRRLVEGMSFVGTNR